MLFWLKITKRKKQSSLFQEPENLLHGSFWGEIFFQCQIENYSTTLNVTREGMRLKQKAVFFVFLSQQKKSFFESDMSRPSGSYAGEVSAGVLMPGTYSPRTRPGEKSITYEDFENRSAEGNSKTRVEFASKCCLL